MSRRIVIDTNIILNRPQLLRQLVELCDKVYIPRTVIRELNYQKDHGDKQRKTLASLCLSMLIELKSDRLVIDDNYVHGNNDDRIFATAVSIARENTSDIVYLLSNDKDFKLKSLAGLANLKVIDSNEFDIEFCKTVKINIRESQKFFDAVKRRKYEYARQLLSSDINLNYIDPETGFTPLVQAVRNRDLSMVTWLLTVPGVDINKVDENKYKIPPLSHAIQIKNMPIIKLLIKHGVNVNEPSMNGRNSYNTPLMIASWGGNFEAVKVLVENGACINQVDKGNGFSALIKAVYKNHPKIVAYLLDCKADRTICSFEKMTALDYAYSKNENGEYEEIISLLNA